MQEIQLNGRSPDIAQENAEKLKQLFPEVVSEGRIDFKKLRVLLGDYIENGDEYYCFTWRGKSAAFRESMAPSAATLRPCIDESKDWEKTQNLYIEGDNLEVLKLLQKSYAGKIKMIYIDPPYNTGKEFIYTDKWRDRTKDCKKAGGKNDAERGITASETDDEGGKHSNWLNMMYPRLILARNLLTDDGVIFISIDDKELANLIKLGNEVFGENNFVTVFVWEKKKKPSFLHKNVGKLTEYIVCYTKNSDCTFPFSLESTTEGKKYPLNNAGNALSIIKFPPDTVSFNMDDQVVKPQDMSEGNIKTRLLNELIIVNGKNLNEFSLEGEWRYSQKKIDEIIKNNEKIVISKIPFRPNHIKAGGEIKKMKNILSPVHYNMETNEDATSQIIELFGFNIFDNPKPVKLIYSLIKAVSYSDKNAIILDFFSGSATTAHSVMQLNADDGGNRKFIMVQLPEAVDSNLDAYKKGYINIADIGKERIRRAGEKIKAELKKKTNPEHLDTGFKVFKLSSSNFSKWTTETQSTDTGELPASEAEDLVQGRTHLDILYEIMLKCGLNLNCPIETCNFSGTNIYSIDHGRMIVCLDTYIKSDLADDILKLIKKLKPDMVRLVVRNNAFKTENEKICFKEKLKESICAYFENTLYKPAGQCLCEFITI